MLVVDTKDKLQKLKLKGMLQAFEEQTNMRDITDLTFEERFGFLVDREVLERENRSLQNRLKEAKLKENALLENVDFKTTKYHNYWTYWLRKNISSLCSSSKIL
jgi:IstB-like ATP binding protein